MTSVVDSSSAAQLLADAQAAVAATRLPEARALAQRLWDAHAEGRIGVALAGEAGQVLCLALFRMGALAELIDTAEQVLPLLNSADKALARAELLRYMTLAGCELGRHALALRCGNENFSLAQRLGDQRSLSLACTALGACFERMGDPWQAERLLGDALAMALQLNDPFLLQRTYNNLCAITIGAFYLQRAIGDEVVADGQAALRRAEGYAREAQALLVAHPDPFAEVFIVGNLGEVLVHLGEPVEARSLLERALAQARAQNFAAQTWRIRCSIGELLLAEGRPADAREALAALLEEIGSTETPATLMRVHFGLYLANRRLGRAEDALLQLERYQAIQRLRTINQLQAQSQLFVTRVEAEQMRQEAERARLVAEQERDRATAHAAEALLDPLTGLGNRRFLDRQLPLLLSGVGQAHPLCAALVDVDHFKPINDRHGHQLGDQVLVTLAELLRVGTRGADVVVRLGGEEFLIVLPDTPMERAFDVCERLRQQVAQHDWSALMPGLQVTLSIGLARAHLEPDPDDLVGRADLAMYRAKAAGRNRVEVDTDAQADTLETSPA